MKASIISVLLASTLVLLPFRSVHAEVVKASPEHYELKQQANSTLSAPALWSRLIKPESWWHPDHTFSGDSGNLSLDAQAGGLWREDWPAGSVLHGQVLLIIENKQLRLRAPFGPLQGNAVNVIWTITINPNDNGSTVVFEEIANGSKNSKLDELALAVDFVKTEAIKRLVQ